MPQQQIVPTWLAWNNADFTSPTGLTDLRTGQPFEAGGLGLGDYFDATEKEANTASYLANGLLHWGRYRLVQVDSGATASIVKTGTVGYVRQGTYVQGVFVALPGSGGTPGTYTYAVPAGTAGGSGAVIQIVIDATGSISSASVVQGGFNYTAAFTLPPPLPGGITGGQVFTELNSTPNIVTSIDQALNPPGAVSGPWLALPRPVVFLNSITPGNYGFIQELGLATVLTVAGNSANPGFWAAPSANGQVNASGGLPTTAPWAIGQFIDLTGNVSILAKIYLSSVPVCQD